jgi:hypothetical protein
MNDLLLKLAELLERFSTFILGFKLAQQENEIERQRLLNATRKEVEEIEKEIAGMSDEEIREEIKKNGR